MNIDWASLGLVAIVSLAVAVVVVALVAFSMVGFSAREEAAAGTPGALSPAAGTAIGYACLVVVGLIVLYGLWLVAQTFLLSLF